MLLFLQQPGEGGGVEGQYSRSSRHTSEKRKKQHTPSYSLTTGGGGLEDEGLDDARPAAEEDDLSMSEDEMDDFIDDGRRTGQVKARRAPKGVSSHGIEVPPPPPLEFIYSH